MGDGGLGIDGEISAEARVARFLESVEARRRRSVRVRIAAAGVGIVVATVAYLTSIGVPSAGPSQPMERAQVPETTPGQHPPM